MKIAAISVVIPCYNCESTINKTLVSVFNQTVIPAEIILIDDVSTDKSKQVIEKIIVDHPKYNIKLFCLNENSGPGIARNEGWNNATQKWLAFLDADDVWHPRKIELQYNYLEANPSIDVCGHKSVLYNGLQEDYKSLNKKAENISFKKMLFSNRLPTRSVMLKRDLNYRFKGKLFTEDYLMWLEILADKYTSRKLDYVLAYSLRPEFSIGGYSGQLWTHEKRELNAFKYLLEKGKISLVFFCFFSVFSFVKFLKRAIVNFIRKL